MKAFVEGEVKTRSQKITIGMNLYSVCPVFSCVGENYVTMFIIFNDNPDCYRSNISISNHL